MCPSCAARESLLDVQRRILIYRRLCTKWRAERAQSRASTWDTSGTSSMPIVPLLTSPASPKVRHHRRNASAEQQTMGNLSISTLRHACNPRNSTDAGGDGDLRKGVELRSNCHVAGGNWQQTLP
jgi:hypothetical protein